MCNYMIICFNFSLGHVADEVQDSKRIISWCPISSTLYALCGDIGDARCGGVVYGVSLSLAGGNDAGGEV